jgi:hypothetical protein
MAAVCAYNNMPYSGVKNRKLSGKLLLSTGSELRLRTLHVETIRPSSVIGCAPRRCLINVEMGSVLKPATLTLMTCSRFFLYFSASFK